MTQSASIMKDAVHVFDKDYTALKSYLLGRNYYMALRCMAFARELHSGTRKDGRTPEFHHQIRINFTCLNLRGVRNEELVQCLGFLHDTPEDKNISHALLAHEFNDEIATKACKLDKHQHSDEEACMKAISHDPDCSIVKGADNKDNIGSMVGAFTREKMVTYMTRTREQIIPMLKQAAIYFPDQSFAYGSLRSTLKDQLHLYDRLLSLPA